MSSFPELPQVNVDDYLALLSSTSTDNNPYVLLDNNEALVAGFVKMATGVAEFVQAARVLDGFGYDEARSTLEDLVHTFPLSEAPVDPFEAILSALAASLGEELAAALEAEAKGGAVQPSLFDEIEGGEKAE